MARFTEMEKMVVSGANAATSTDLSVSDSIRHFVASVRRRLANRARRQAVARELGALSNRMLDDLGLTRADIAATAKLTADRAFPVRGTFAGDVARLVDGIAVRPVADYLARREAANHLYALDERLLADVGLTRGDIPAVLRSVRRASKQDEAGFDAVRQLRVYNRSRAAVKELAAYDDRMLDDMGFVRGDIQWVAKKLANRSVVANVNGTRPHAA